MIGFVSYVIGEDRAYDENGDGRNLEFTVEPASELPRQSYVVIDGIPHRCSEFSLFVNLLSFWVRPVDSSEMASIEIERKGAL